jgi:hypothetical protein
MNPLFLPCLTALLLLCNCSQATDEIFTQEHVKILSDRDTLFSESAQSRTARISIDNPQAVHKLEIKKRHSKGISHYQTFLNADLKEPLSFEYPKNPQDDDWFNFILEAYDAGHRKLTSRILYVCTVEGIVISNPTRLARVTGRSLPGETLPNPNRTDERYNLGGTDLGIIWDMENGSYGLFFGDSYGRNFTPVEGGGPGPAGDWRSNVLAFSTDTDLDDGITFSAMATDAGGNAREIAYSEKNTSGNGDYTAIPTSAIRAGGVDYLHYMNIRTWNGWVTNHSALYASNDDGRTWNYCPSIRFSSDSPFGQVAYAKKDGYVYMIGTPTGRTGPGRLARIPERSMLIKCDYEYWNEPSGWVKGNEHAASIVLEGAVGEASLMYHKGFKRWIVTYFDEKAYALMLRDAPDITGPWSPEKVLVRGSEYAQLYGSFMHPAKDSGNRLYFTMSQWAPYNVFLMRVDMQYIE